MRLPFRPDRHLLARPLARLRRFGRSEDGSMIVFGMFLFVMMLIVAGMAVDVMRAETQRSRLQATSDRAVLAAADLDQARDGTTVVNDYFRAAGLLDKINSVTVTQTFNMRQVSVDADLDLDTMFMNWVGVNRLNIAGDSAARESVGDVEVVLVLDISGSMVQGGTTRLANLRVAARNFVQTVLQNDTQNRISIAIVPFNGQVNLGPMPTQGGTTLASWYTGITDRIPTNYGATFNYLGCVDLPASVYGVQTIPRAQAMPATQLVDTFTGTQQSNAFYSPTATWSGSTSYGTPQPANMWCPARDASGNSTAGNVVRLPSHDISALQNQINGLVGVGATSINAGMRWGMTLLDPASQGMFTALGVPFSGRPYAYDRENTAKIIVLMTDGENFPEERVNGNGAGTGFRSGVSPIWRAADGNYSIFHPSKVNTTGTGSTRLANIAASRPFWVPHLSQWHSRPWTGTAPNSGNPYMDETQRIASNANWRVDSNGDGVCSSADDGRGTFNNSTQACWPSWGAQTWPQVWTNLRMSWVSWQLYARPLVLSSDLAWPTPTRSDRNAAHAAQMDLFRTQTDEQGDTPTMDAQLDQMCDRARSSGVEVYAIAFEAPTRGQQVIQDCASSGRHYTYVQSDGTGNALNAVFQNIAAQINQLRLIN